MDDVQHHMDEILADFFCGREEYQRFIDLYGRLNGLERYALLDAHGSGNRSWIYYDEGRKRSVQKWISSVDGKYYWFYYWRRWNNWKKCLF